MRHHSRRLSRQSGQGGSFWLSFSDLMSALLLVFLLVMFYSVYQYLDMLEVKTAELMHQSGLLDEKEAQLTLKDEELRQSQQKLTESEEELITQQAKLLLFEQELNASEDLLSQQRAQLDEKNALLESQEQALSQAQSQLDQQQLELSQAQALLSQQQTELSQAQNQLSQQQDLLSRQQQDMDSAQALLRQAQDQLDDQQDQLLLQQSQLAQQQDQLLLQQSQLAQQQDQMAQQQQRLDALVGVRARIIASLAQAMQDAGIRATVDRQTGSITLDASVLFDSGHSTLKESGKRVLDEFLPVYLSVLMDSQNIDNVSEIIIEGHTDTDGSYMSNLKLSQERALSVMEYILADDYRMITGGMKRQLRKIATANGRSYSNPIYTESGRVNKTASRRVEFKFRLQDEQMIESMRDILEDMN